MINVSEPAVGSVEALLVNECLAHNRLTQGPMVERFERELANVLGARHVVATSSGTTALHLLLVAAGVERGHEVLVPNVTFVATANAVRYCGATPVLVEVNPFTWCIDPEDAAKKVTEHTKAILPVHLYGVPCFMEKILELADEHRLLVLEDAAEGLGGSYAGRALGTLGLAGAFSFYGNKVLTTGEGGAVATDSEELAARLRFLRGQAMDPARRYYHPEVGFNYRLTDLQAAIGVGQVSRMAELLKAREAIFAFYQARLTGCASMPETPAAGHQAPWLFTCLVRNRDRVAAYMRARGVDTRPAFVPLNRLPPYRQPSALFPNSKTIGDHGLSLPTHPGLTRADLLRVVDVFQEAISCA